MDDFGHGMNFRDHAVLYRMNAQSNQLEYAFKRNGIPYRIIGGTRFSTVRRSRTCWPTCASSRHRATTCA